MSDEEKRRDQLTRMSGSTEADAAPRIVVSEGTGGAKRIDIAETAAVRPGDPTEQVPQDQAPHDDADARSASGG